MRSTALTVILLILLITSICGNAYADDRGTFRLDWYSGGAMGITFINITLQEEADILCIWTTDNVTNVVLDELVMEEESIVPKIIWTANELSSNQVICLHAYTGEVIPRFRVTCRNGDGAIERWYIEESMKDGELLLLSPEQEENAVFPVIAAGLQDTEAYTEMIEERMLLLDSKGQEYAEYASGLLQLWERERILLWGGYAQSYAEQDWIEKRDAILIDQDAVNLAALMTRDHVYMLLGLD